MVFLFCDLLVLSIFNSNIFVWFAKHNVYLLLVLWKRHLVYLKRLNSVFLRQTLYMFSCTFYFVLLPEKKLFRFCFFVHLTVIDRVFNAMTKIFLACLVTMTERFPLADPDVRYIELRL